MSLFETLKFVHVLAVVIWLGGGIVETLFTIRARRADPGHQLGRARDMAFLGSRLLGPASGFALLSGIAMVIERPAIHFGDTWVIIGLVGIAASGTIGGAFFSRKGKELLATLEAGKPADALLRTIGRVAVLDQLILLTVVWAMITKPGA